MATAISFDSSNDTAANFYARAETLASLGMYEAAQECAEAADRAAELEYWAEEQMVQLRAEAEGRGWDWEPQWGDQPYDEHCRAALRAKSAGPLS